MTAVECLFENNRAELFIRKKIYVDVKQVCVIVVGQVVQCEQPANMFPDTPPYVPQVGDIVVGQVVQYEQVGALVDIGGKSSALLAPAEASMQRVDDLEDFMMIGDHREFQVCKRCLSKLTPTIMKESIKWVGTTELERHRGVDRLPYPNT